MPDQTIDASRLQRIVRPSWYRFSNPDVSEAGIDPVEHYTGIGYSEDRDPNALFNCSWYRRVADVPLGVPAVVHYLTRGAKDGADPGPLFDSRWYLRQAGSLPEEVTPLEHYLEVGAERGLDAHPLFSASWYLAYHEVNEIDGLSAYEHFLETGWRWGASPSALFDTASYLRLNPDVSANGINPFEHFVGLGLAEGRAWRTHLDRRTHRPKSHDELLDRSVALLRPEWYLSNYPDVRDARVDPVAHFRFHGLSEDRRPCALFDGSWYRQHYDDVPPSMSSLEHYLTIGGGSGRDPSPLFDSGWYLRQLGGTTIDVTPLEHYLTHGWKLGLDPHPLFSTAWYIERHGPHDADGTTLYEHYLTKGWRRGHDPSAVFKMAAYQKLNPDYGHSGESPLSHFLRTGVGVGQSVLPIFDRKWYEAENELDPIPGPAEPFIHWCLVGSEVGRACSEDPLSAALGSFLVQAQRRARLWLRPGTDDDPLPSIDWVLRASEIGLDHERHPVVSIVIPTLDHAADVIRCIESLVAAMDSTPFEVIVVDDCSSESQAELLASIRGVVYLRLDENQGFAGACTAGLEIARGSYLMLLNNDVEVLPGWLDALVADASEQPEAGIFGSMIVRPDLCLQEAGCIVWSDGGCWQYGSGCDLRDWRYRSRREVDYCSAASLLIRRALWEQIGGFDPVLNPAYYEDADLCFAACELGSVTIYEPASVVLHNEGSSHGTDPFGVKRFQHRNKSRASARSGQRRSLAKRHDPMKSGTMT